MVQRSRKHSMFFQLLFIHLFRPFLKYTQATSPLPNTVSPRKLCTQAAAMISKLMRLYKRSHGLRQIPNIAVYITHSACTIHLLNLPDKNAKRDIVHGLKHLEEIAEGWLCARRTLAILSVLAHKWNVELPDDAAVVLSRTDSKFGSYASDLQSPTHRRASEVLVSPTHAGPQHQHQQQAWQQSNAMTGASTYMRPRHSVASGTTRAAVRSNSGSYQPPPQDAKGLQAQQYPSATTTPATPQNQYLQRTQPGGSPSEIFGGIEQLIRDSSDWAFRDQAQLATGFENWDSVAMDSSTWTTTSPTNGGMTMTVNGGSVGGPVMGPPPHGGPAVQPNGTSMVNANIGYPQAAPSNGVDGMGMANWLNSMNAYNSMAASYNEDEWYQ